MVMAAARMSERAIQVTMIRTTRAHVRPPDGMPSRMRPLRQSRSRQQQRSFQQQLRQYTRRRWGLLSSRLRPLARLWPTASLPSAPRLKHTTSRSRHSSMQRRISCTILTSSSTRSQQQEQPQSRAGAVRRRSVTARMLVCKRRRCRRLRCRRCRHRLGSTMSSSRTP